MSILEEIIIGFVQGFVPAVDDTFHEVRDTKQQIKDLFLEIYDNDYDEFEKKVKEL